MPCAVHLGRRAVYAAARSASVSTLVLTLAWAAPAWAQTGPPPLGGPPSTEGALSLDLDIVAKQLDIARSNIQPSLGATRIRISAAQTIETQPQGDNAPLNQLLLQAPGVAQDCFGQLHVRGDHANLQYRINGVQLPEGIIVFGQALQTAAAPTRCR